MSVPFYMDVNERAEITRQLRVREVDVLTSQEDGTREFSDSDLLDRATFLGRVLFTGDVDLELIISRLSRRGNRQRDSRYVAGIETVKDARAIVAGIHNCAIDRSPAAANCNQILPVVSADRRPRNLTDVSNQDRHLLFLVNLKSGKFAG